MGTKPDDAPVHQEMTTRLAPAAMPPYSPEEGPGLSYLGDSMSAGVERAQDWASPELERGRR